jgi:RHS repeat-associated protein
MIQVTRPAADGTTLQVGESTEHHPTLSGIVLAQVDATGGRTEYTYDALGRSIAIKTSLGGTVTNTYDALGRVTRNETRDASNIVVASTSTDYDHFDQPLATTHADGSTEVNTYDASGHLIKKGGNAAYPLRYTYDALGRIATMTDGNNSTTAWAYNDLGQVEAKTYADGSVWRYTYTDTGQLATRTWARTQSGDQPLVTTYSYTPSGQLASVAYNDGTTPSVTFTYDQQGRRLTMTTGSAPGSAGISARDAITTDNIYDPAGRLMAIDNGTQTLAYTYNPYGQRLSLSVSGTSTSTLNLNYNYDVSGRLVTISSDDQTHRYTYHPGTRQLAIRTSGNVTTTYAYDTGQGMLTSIENKAGNTVVSKYAYTINNRGQRTQVSQSGAAFAAPSGYGWLYNTKGEVVAANHTTDTTKNRAYDYDPIGNRRWSTEGNASTATPPQSLDPLSAAIAEYTSNNLNQYTSVSSVPSVVNNSTYDADGNMTDTGNGAQYTWDAENRLIRVTKTDGTEIRYAYDGESRRIMREVYKNSSLQSATRYLYDGWNVIAEFDALSSDLRPLSSYTWGLDLSGSLQGVGGVGGLLSKTDHTSPSPLIFNYVYDGNGNVSELIAIDNGIAAHYEYDAFGKIITKQGFHADTNTYRFSTKPLDVESELYYYGYRFYDPQLGRWPNRDPIGEEGGGNLYRFVDNVPILLVDILGNRKIPNYNYFENITEVENVPRSSFEPSHSGAVTIANTYSLRSTIKRISANRCTIEFDTRPLRFLIKYYMPPSAPGLSTQFPTIRDHEMEHVRLTGRAWNIAINFANSLDGKIWCECTCAKKASEMSLAYYALMLQSASVDNVLFDLQEYANKSAALHDEFWNKYRDRVRMRDETKAKWETAVKSYNDGNCE